jgi:hypothetical protein
VQLREGSGSIPSYLNVRVFQVGRYRDRRLGRAKVSESINDLAPYNDVFVTHGSNKRRNGTIVGHFAEDGSGSTPYLPITML